MLHQNQLYTSEIQDIIKEKGIIEAYRTKLIMTRNELLEKNEDIQEKIIHDLSNKYSILEKEKEKLVF